MISLDEIPFATGVYCFKNLCDNKRYVGQSRVLKSNRGLRDRINAHLSLLRNNKDSIHLQRAWNKHGAENFIVEILVICSDKEVDDFEEYFIKYYQTCDPEFGYNLNPKAKGAGAKSEETIRKIQSDESKRKRSEKMIGRKRITNGLENRWLVGEIPEGFRLGITSSPSNWTNPGFTTLFDPVTGENIYCSTKDPRYLSGELLHISKKKWLGKKTKEQVRHEELQSLPTGEGITGTKGTVWINNGERNRRTPKDSPLPAGWVNGRLKTPKLGRNQFSERG